MPHLVERAHADMLGVAAALKKVADEARVLDAAYRGALRDQARADAFVEYARKNRTAVEGGADPAYCLPPGRRPRSN